MSKDYLVYEHWRPDLGICFYVGKGRRKRAYSFRRNIRYDRIVAKLKRLGLSVEVRILAKNLNDQQAIELEIERIAFWRSSGVKTANFTDGGDGAAGRALSEKTRRKIRAKAKGRIVSEETKSRMAQARIGRRHSEETKAKIALSAKTAQKLRSKRDRVLIGEDAFRSRMIALSRKAVISRSRPVVKGFS